MRAGAATSDLLMSDGPGLRPRVADRWAPGMVLSAGAHLLLVLALALGVHWKLSNPPAMEAEVWSEIPKAAAPDAAPPPPPEPPPQPVEKALPPPTPEPVVEPPKQEPVPDIVVRKEVKPKEHKKHKHEEPVEVFETTPPKPKVEPKPKVKPQPKPEPQPEPKQVEPKVDNAKAAAEREAHRKAQLQRMMSQLGGTLGTSDDGQASRSAGPSAAYAGRIKARIKPRIVFADTVNGNPEAVVEVRCAPDGRIVSRKLTQSSGVPAWDDAVLRAIDRTEILPMDETGKVPSVIQISFRPNDL